MDGVLLNIIDENGNIIGEATGEDIHKKGLLHREIHVWFYTPKGEVIFQHRAKSKDTFPDMLDATVGGHVEVGSDYEDTALKEMEEETGVIASKSDLKLVKTVRSKHSDPIMGITNNVIRKVFAYKYEGNPEDLRIEKGKSEGFEVWHIEKLGRIAPDEEKRFIPSFLNQEHLEMYKNFFLV